MFGALLGMADQFAASSEFQRKYGMLTNREFVERIYRDVRLLRLYEGTSEIQKQIISKGLLREYQER